MTQIVYTTGNDVRGQSLWRVNANGSVGTLTLQSDDNARLQGSITFDDGPGNDSIEGGWDDATGRIEFTRLLAGNVTTQTFVGFLGDNHPEQLLLAGTFTESDVPPNAPRTSFAWFASSSIRIV
jgi:hypothetical protein